MGEAMGLEKERPTWVSKVAVKMLKGGSEVSLWFLAEEVEQLLRRWSSSVERLLPPPRPTSGLTSLFLFSCSRRHREGPVRPDFRDGDDEDHRQAQEHY